jgi:3-oxoacyl-[acyl-carrier protein] reductase
MERIDFSLASMDLLDKKNVLFCGAGRGLGSKIASLFCSKRWEVIILDLTCDQELLDLGASFYPCDLSDFEITERCIYEIAKKSNSIDALINCVRYRKKTGEKLHFAEEWKKALDVDLHSYFYATSIVCELMKTNGNAGSIVNISSVVSEFVTLKESLSYHTAKAAINQMTRYLAVQYGPHNIRLNAVLPGLISTQQAEKSSDDLGASLYAKYAKEIPLRRSGSPQEVAELIFFLISPASSFITGQSIVIDGGLNIREQLDMSTLAVFRNPI